MNLSKPNRSNVQSANATERQRVKESGDQHTLPTGEPLEDPHRPQRLSRHDMHKITPEAAAPDESEPS